ncbi:MAG TPA: hypothetical protein VKP30_25435 [Polyangiaceae bacterium]|nr:hypothetical protein [Polyangiaceae bacterium]
MRKRTSLVGEPVPGVVSVPVGSEDSNPVTHLLWLRFDQSNSQAGDPQGSSDELSSPRVTLEVSLDERG